MNDSTLTGPHPSTVVDTYTFSVIPTGDFDFVAFLIDIPTLAKDDDGAARAARRAWWTAFHMLGPNGAEPEDFSVAEWIGSDKRGHRGREVNSGGF